MPDDSVARAIKQGCSTIMRHNPDDGIMAELVQGSPVPVDGLEIRLRSRQSALLLVQRKPFEKPF
jgi:hypothetical protein